MFSYALKAEAVHAKLYQMALEALQQGQDLTGVEFFLCPVCGNIEIGKAPEVCPICGAKGEKFIKM
jgi:rubrerythrin